MGPRCGRLLPRGGICNRCKGHAGICQQQKRVNKSGRIRGQRTGISGYSRFEYAMITMHGLEWFDWWAQTWQAQNGCCYLCGDELSGKPRECHTDHDHSCCPKDRSCPRCRRGIACSRCNQIIGLAFEDPARLRRIADSLERLPALAPIANESLF